MTNFHQERVAAERMDALLDACLVELGMPTVVFLHDLQFFARCAGTDVSAHNTKRLRHGMAARGYAPARPSLGAKEWKVGELRSTIAFVRREIPKELRGATVLAASEQRS